MDFITAEKFIFHLASPFKAQWPRQMPGAVLARGKEAMTKYGIASPARKSAGWRCIICWRIVAKMSRRRNAFKVACIPTSILPVKCVVQRPLYLRALGPGRAPWGQLDAAEQAVAAQVTDLGQSAQSAQ